MNDPFPRPMDDDPSTSAAPGPALFLVLAGSALLLAALVLGPPLAPSSIWNDFGEPDLLISTHIRVGFSCIGFWILGWGVYELVSRKPGPLLGFSLLLILPMLGPLTLLGYGSAPDAWAAAFAGEWAHRTGAWVAESASKSPFYQAVLALLVPQGGWSALFLVGTLTGMTGCWVWLGLPNAVADTKRRAIAVGVLVQPLYLLACVTGQEAIWQTCLTGASGVLLLRALCTRGLIGLSSFGFSGLLLGLAAGFHPGSLFFLPLWLFASAIYRPATEAKIWGPLLLLAAALATAGLAMAFSPASDFPPAHLIPAFPGTEVVPYRLIRFVLPPPVLVLTLIALLRMRSQIEWLYDTERALTTLALGSSALGIVMFLIWPQDTLALTVTLPFLAVLWGLFCPRGVLMVGLPSLALWGLISIPILPSHPAQALRPVLTLSAGPLVEEAGKRFAEMRQGQQLLMASPQKRTVFLVGHDWPILACLRPDWVVEPGILRNPACPVEYCNWLDRPAYQALKGLDAKIYVVGSTGVETLKRYGYDPLDDWGTLAWNAKTPPRF